MTEQLRARIDQLEEEIRHARKDNERLRDAIHGGEGISVASVWAAFIDFRGEMREGFKEIHLRQDTTNGTLKRHEWQIAFASGGVAVVSFLIAIFGVYLLVRFG